MLRYEKGAEPACLTTLRTTPGAGFGSLSGEDKKEIREALVRDQAGLCAYCQRRIEASDQAMKVEHWLAQSTSGQQQLHWQHMLGVCPGVTTVDRERWIHCDTHRGNDALFLHPVDGRGPNPRDFLKYSAYGHMRSDNRQAAQDIMILNLDDGTKEHILRRNRAAVYEQMMFTLKNRFTKFELQRRLRACELQPGTQAPAYAEFTRYHLLKWLTRM